MAVAAVMPSRRFSTGALAAEAWGWESGTGKRPVTTTGHYL
jgi:hypothetical protein